MSAELKKPEIPFVDLVAQYATIREEVDQAISEVLNRADFILGREVGLFEEEFAAYCGTGDAIGVDSGGSALELSLRAFDVGPGDEVITAANTFIATAFAISQTGATPVLVDVDPQTFTIVPSAIEAAITPQTKAVIPVHLCGQPADMDPILAIARSRGLIVIEDACQAHGAEYKGQRAGSIGNAAAFSFYPGKNLGAYGDGGMIVTNDRRIAEQIRVLHDYGQHEKNRHAELGYNRRLDTLQAAVLRVKLRHLDEWNSLRRRHAASYDGLLVDSRVAAPYVAGYATNVYHLYAVQVPGKRDELRAFLWEQGIATGIHYPIPIHLQEAYRNLGYQKGDFLISEKLAENTLSLPMFPELRSDQIRSVTEAIEAFYRAEAS